jgi:hypothetical protein
MKSNTSVPIVDVDPRDDADSKAVALNHDRVAESKQPQPQEGNPQEDAGPDLIDEGWFSLHCMLVHPGKKTFWHAVCMHAEFHSNPLYHIILMPFCAGRNRGDGAKLRPPLCLQSSDVACCPQAFQQDGSAGGKF